MAGTTGEKRKVRKSYSLADTVYFALKNRILHGELKPGTPMREEQLADELKVSRTPLRKALTQLLAEGFLVKGRDRSLRIPEISPQELRDTLAARKLLETAAVAEAARHATAGDLERIEHLILDEEEALRRHDSLLVSSLDTMFHNYIAVLSGNTAYAEFIEILGYKVALFLGLSNTLGAPIREALKEHAEILRALRGKSPERAAAAMRQHLENVERRIAEGMEESSASPLDE